MQRLTKEEIDDTLKKFNYWKLVDDKWLERRYKFSTFTKGIDFVNAIAELSEQVNHHPLISIDYKVVTLSLTSWRAKGVTMLDVDLIERYDKLYNKENSVE